MRRTILVITFLIFSATCSHAATREVVYDGGEIYLHVKKEHVTTVVFPEAITEVVRSFGADNYVIQRDRQDKKTLELMPTDVEVAEMTISGASGESYVIRCVAKDNFDTKVTISTIGQADNAIQQVSEKIVNQNSEKSEKTVESTKDIVPAVVIVKQTPQNVNVSQVVQVESPSTTQTNSGVDTDLPAALNLKITLKGNDLPLKVYLSTISQVTGYNIITTPEIESQHTSINLENIEVWRALKSLLYKFGWGFKVSKEDLIITATETRMFYLRMPAVDQSFSDQTSNESYADNQNSTSGSNTSQQSQAVKVGSKIAYENAAPKISLWTDLENSIKSIITPKTGSYSIARSTGTITVSDSPGVLDKISAMIDSTNQILSLQQTFEIQIYEITLSDTKEMGVDWGAVENSLKGSNALSLASNYSSVGFVAGQALTLTGNTSNSGKDGVSAVLKALATQGEVHTISKPKITVSNLFPAIIQSVTSIPYISGTGETISNQSTVSNVITSEVSEGLTMRLDAKISDDRRTVLNISVAENTLDSMTSVPAGGGLSIQEPQVSTKSITTNVEIDPDKTLILGGLISTTKNNSTQGVPYLSRIPFIGNAFEYKDNSVTKSELLIFITPKEITKNS